MCALLSRNHAYMDPVFQPFYGHRPDVLSLLRDHRLPEIFLEQIALWTEKSGSTLAAKDQLCHIIHDLAEIVGMGIFPCKKTVQQIHHCTAEGCTRTGDRHPHKKSADLRTFFMRVPVTMRVPATSKWSPVSHTPPPTVFRSHTIYDILSTCKIRSTQRPRGPFYDNSSLYTNAGAVLFTVRKS